jgi:hypothetical protein
MLSPNEIDLLRQKELRGELTLEDTLLFIQSTRAAFLARPEPKEKGTKTAKAEDVDFF